MNPAEVLQECYDRVGSVLEWNETVLLDVSKEHTANIIACLDELNIPFNIINDQVIFSGTNAIDFLGLIQRQRDSAKLKSPHEFMVSAVCKVYKTAAGAVVPYKSRHSDVGYDLTLIRVHKRVNNVCTMYDTGVQIQLSRGFYGEIVPRSSLIKSGYMLANSVGIIDRSYTGNLYIAVVKVDPDAPDLELPYRGFQLIIRPQVYADIIDATGTEIVNTWRDCGGFGSTGK